MAKAYRGVLQMRMQVNQTLMGYGVRKGLCGTAMVVLNNKNIIILYMTRSRKHVNRRKSRKVKRTRRTRRTRRNVKRGGNRARNMICKYSSNMYDSREYHETKKPFNINGEDIELTYTESKNILCDNTIPDGDKMGDEEFLNKWRVHQ